VSTSLSRRYFSSSRPPLSAAGSDRPIKVAIIGLVHGHVNGWLRADRHAALELVGVYEPAAAVAQKYQPRYELDSALFFNDLDARLETQRPEAAWVFTSTVDHERVVEVCARRGIHVIVEKPLAVDLASAKRMAATARKHGNHLLTNLETTWYASLATAYRLAVEENALGDLTIIVSHCGHRGPVGFNVNPEFLAWLTDPKLNGGGASADFACYGANIMTWLTRDERPLAVTAVIGTSDPATYPAVDDTATILVQYPKTEPIIQAAWNWPFPRKDVHLYAARASCAPSTPNGTIFESIGGRIRKPGEPIRCRPRTAMR
jgi:predicted dehydrogenase